MSVPTITALIPTRRRPLLLKQALESVLAQTWPDLEVLVSDNASRDGTREIVESFAARDPRVRYHEQPEDIGALRNFQYLLDQANTPWVSILADDDVLLPGFYAHAIERLERHAEARFFCGQTVVYYADDGTHRLNPNKGWNEGLVEAGAATGLMARQLFTWTGCLFSREVCDAAGPLIDGSYIDLVFMVRAAARFPFVVSLAPCAVFRSWSEGSFRAMEAEEVTCAYRVSLEALLSDPALGAFDREAIRAWLEALPQRVLGHRASQAFGASDWERFDRASAALATTRKVKLGRRLQIYAGRRRNRHPHLLQLVRWLLQRRSGVPAGAEVTPFEELVARYAAVLAEGSE